MKRGIVYLLLLTLIVSCFGGCSANNGNDIIVLFTNDVHCGINKDIGYAGLAAYKKNIQAKTPYTLLVDCGDSVQGDVIGTVSKGGYPAKIMKSVGYDLAVLGNHEFDYGMNWDFLLIAILPQAEAVCAPQA